MIVKTQKRNNLQIVFIFVFTLLLAADPETFREQKIEKNGKRRPGRFIKSKYLLLIF